MHLLGENYLHLREVEAFDQYGVNVALNKPATQSSTAYAGPASNAVDGYIWTISHTELQQGKYQLSSAIFMHISFKSLSISFSFVKEPGGKSIWGRLWRL